MDAATNCQGLAGGPTAGVGSQGPVAAGSAAAGSGSGGGGSGLSGLNNGAGGNGGSGVVVVSYCALLTTPNVPPVWVTTNMSLGTLTSANLYASGLTTSQLVATDPDGIPVTYTLTSGSLPPGLSLSSTGSISGLALPTLPSPVSGCPNPSQTYSFTVAAFDGSFSVSMPFSISVSLSVNLRNTTLLTGTNVQWTPPASRLSLLELLLVGGGGGGESVCVCVCVCVCVYCSRGGKSLRTVEELQTIVFSLWRFLIYIFFSSSSLSLPSSQVARGMLVVAVLAA